MQFDNWVIVVESAFEQKDLIKEDSSPHPQLLQSEQGCAVPCNGPVIQETGTLLHEIKKYFDFIFLTSSLFFRKTLNQIRN